MTPIDIIERTREYVTQNFLYAHRDVRLTDEQSLLESGVLDSMSVLELVQFLQDAFAISVGDDEITTQHLDSLQSIADFVSAKRQAATFS